MPPAIDSRTPPYIDRKKILRVKGLCIVFINRMASPKKIRDFWNSLVRWDSCRLVGWDPKSQCPSLA
eukprot:1154431-Pelagomonas_calceolata.AAC.5